MPVQHLAARRVRRCGGQAIRAVDGIVVEVELVERDADLRLDAMRAANRETAAHERFDAGVSGLVDVGHQAVAWRVGIVHGEDFVADARIVRGDVPRPADALRLTRRGAPADFGHGAGHGIERRVAAAHLIDQLERGRRFEQPADVAVDLTGVGSARR